MKSFSDSNQANIIEVFHSFFLICKIINVPVHLHAAIQAPPSYFVSIKEQLPAVVSLREAGAFSRNFTTNLTPQFRAFTRT